MDSTPPSSPNDLVPAALADTAFEAQTKAAILREAGIRTWVFDAERGWFGAQENRLSGGRVPVFVRRADVDRARSELQRQIEDSIDIDWDEVDVGQLPPEEAARAGSGIWFLIAVIAIIAAAVGLLSQIGTE